MFPAWLRSDGLAENGNNARRANLSGTAQRYLDCLGADVEDLFHHVVAVLHNPAYRESNAGALQMEWPRIPLPGWPGGESDGAAATLDRSAARGRDLAVLLDPDTPVPGVTQGPLRPEIAAIAVPSTTNRRNMAGEDFAVTAGWGHYGQGAAQERAAMSNALPALGETTFDVYLNARTFWRNVPAGVWDYRLGGYQILKKWLSYRERAILERPLSPEEIKHFTNAARRIGAMVLETTDEKFGNYIQ